MEKNLLYFFWVVFIQRLSSPDFYCNFSLTYIVVSTEFFKSKKELISRKTEKNLRLEQYVTEKDVLKYSISMEVCNKAWNVLNQVNIENVRKNNVFYFYKNMNSFGDPVIFLMNMEIGFIIRRRLFGLVIDFIVDNLQVNVICTWSGIVDLLPISSSSVALNSH